MATAPLAYIGGDSEETRAANQAYQDALKKMMESLDARKNRMFDPTLLAMAQGFLTPGKTGSFGESLGNVAGNVRQAEEQAAKEEQAAATAGLQAQQMNLQAIRDRQSAQYIANRRGASGEQAAPSGEAPRGVSGKGYKIFEGQGSPVDRIAEAAALSRLTPFEFEKAVQEANSKRYEKTEGGLYDLWTGMFMPSITGKTADFRGYTLPEGVILQINYLMQQGQDDEANRLFNNAIKNVPSAAELAGRTAGATAGATRAESTQRVERNIPGFGTIELPQESAFKYDQAVSSFGVNSPQARNVIAPFIGGAPVAPPVVPAVTPSAAPTEAPNAAPAAPAGGVASKEERALSQRATEQRQDILVQNAAKAEAALPERYQNAQSLIGGTTRVLRAVNESPNYFGLFERPGALAALGTIINEGIQTPSGSLKLAGFEDAVRKSMPRATQRDLDNVRRAGAELAEIELQFTKLYLAKQGQVTEGERKIVRAVPGTISSSPDVLRTRMELLRERARFDQREVDGFNEFKKNRPQATYLDWQNSSQYRTLLNDFSDKTEKLYEDMMAKGVSKPSERPEGVPSNWKLKVDANGNRAWVDPTNPRNYREVQ